MIKLIKSIHTFIWFIMVSAILYTLYAGFTNTQNVMLLISVSLVILKTGIPIINKLACPLTSIARKYTNDKNDNFDIYLPNWLAKHNKTIFGILFALGMILVISNM